MSPRNSVIAPAGKADRDPIHTTATEWRLRLQDPHVSPQDVFAWERWMHEDPRHAEAFRRMEELGQVLRSLARPSLPSESELARDRYDASVPLSKWQHRPQVLRLALAASVLVAALALAVFGSYRLTSSTAKALPTVIATDVGENRSVTLSDHSRITLGGDSEVEVRFERTERHLELKKGEAFFTVAKDAGRPFIVNAGKALVVAVGTEFNVHRGTDRVVVDVIEGRVWVKPSSRLPATLLETFRPKLVPVSVSAGQETTVDALAIEPAAPVPDPALVTSWTSGRLAFRMEPLQRVLEDINRYAKKPIVIEDPDLADVKITGTVLADSVSAWVASLPSALGIAAEEEPDRILLRHMR